MHIPPQRDWGREGETENYFRSLGPPRLAPPRPARPRSQKGIVGPPWPLPEPSGAEARAVLLLGPDRAGPRTSRPRLRAAVGAVLGPGACRGARFREVWLAGSRNGVGEAEECGGFGFCPTFAFVGPRGRGCDLSSGLVDSPGAGRTDCAGAHGRACFSFTPPLRTVFSPQSKAADLGARLERLSAFLEVTQPVRKRLPVIR